MLPQEKRAGQMNLDSIQSLDTFMQNIRTGEIWATASKIEDRKNSVFSFAHYLVWESFKFTVQICMSIKNIHIPDETFR